MSVRVRRLQISKFRQFKDLDLLFVDPRTGEPLDRVCLIGGNGTGKSTILRMIKQFLGPADQSGDLVGPRSVVNVIDGGGHGEARGRGVIGGIRWEAVLEQEKQGWVAEAEAAAPTLRDTRQWEERTRQWLVVYSPPDSESKPSLASIGDVPHVNLNEALKLLTDKATKFDVSQAEVSHFWRLLIALVKEREARLLEFQRKPENRQRIIAEVEEEFLAQNPDILKELAEFWSPLMDRAGLQFDYASASVPVQLTDNLKAYVRLKHEDTKIPYALLSTGLRNFLFRLGHIFAIFRYQPSNDGVLIVDEPENSLHPDFLFDLLEFYQKAAPGAQMFFATHSPIVAAQFRPEERFILKFDSCNGVEVTRGVTAEGDDPNDVLMRDFAVHTLYGKVGLENWRRYRELEHLIQEESDPINRRALAREYLEIGRAYRFPSADEVPS